MLVISAEVGPRDLAQRGDLAEAAHRQLEHADLGVGLEPAERQRHAQLGVVARLRGHGARVRRQSAARMSFVDVLPTEPVMPTTRAPLRSRTRRAERGESA